MSYIHSDAWHDYPRAVRRLIEQSHSIRIVEIGGGANPTLPLDYIRANNLEYTIIDISAEELSKAPDGYHKVVGDISANDFVGAGDYDFAFSNMLAEHVADAEAFHRNVAMLLRGGGLAIHYFPTLFCLPMLVNSVISEGIGQKILDLLLPGLRFRSGKMGKFPAHYKWCFGPLAFQFARFERVGFQVVEYRGTFGYSGYFERYPRTLRLHEAWVRLLLRHPIPWMTSGAQVLLWKPSDGQPMARAIPTPFHPGR